MHYGEDATHTRIFRQCQVFVTRRGLGLRIISIFCFLRDSICEGRLLGRKLVVAMMVLTLVPTGGTPQ